MVAFAMEENGWGLRGKEKKEGKQSIKVYGFPGDKTKR
jgi:hypothetical protein